MSTQEIFLDSFPPEAVFFIWDPQVIFPFSHWSAQVYCLHSPAQDTDSITAKRRLIIPLFWLLVCLSLCL